MAKEISDKADEPVEFEEESSEDFKYMVEMNKEMEKVRRNFRYKSGHSEISAGECYVTGFA